MDNKEKEFLIRLLSTYKIEAEEHLKNLADGLLALEKHPSKEEEKTLLDSIFREAHSLKGASRAVGFHQIEKLCQLMESVLDEWKKGKFVPPPSFYNTLYATLDWLGQQIRQSGHPETLSDPQQFNTLLQKLVQLQHPPPSILQPIAPFQPPPSIMEPFKEKEATIRVISSKLDRLLRQAEEMLIVKMMIQEQKNEWKEMAQWLEEWEKEWQGDPLASLLKSSSPQPLQEFTHRQQEFIRKLREVVQKYSNTASQEQRGLTNLVDNLLEETKKVLMQPFGTLLEGFPRMVRDLSQSLGKNIHFRPIGEDIEMDRRILEALKDPLMHLVRNSADHGIESSQERIKRGKKPEGQITIAASQISGNSVEIVVSDDGKGIDEEEIKQTAIQKGLLDEKEAKQLNTEQTLALLLQSGFSTRSEVTELSGRGLGLGIVNEKVEKLGGKTKIETEKGKGTTFRMTLPLTLAIFRGIRVKAASQEFILPTQNVRQVFRSSMRERKTLEEHDVISYQNETFPYFPLFSLLDLSNASNAQCSIVLIVTAAERSIAVGVEEILSEEEVLVKGLGGQLLRVKNIAAATILESGKVIPILDPFDLIKTAMRKCVSST